MSPKIPLFSTSVKGQEQANEYSSILFWTSAIATEGGLNVGAMLADANKGSRAESPFLSQGVESGTLDGELIWLSAKRDKETKMRSV